MRKLLLPAVAIVVAAIVDQFTKMMALAYLADRPPVKVLGDFFQLTLVYNEGGAMGTNFGSPTYYLLSSILILIFLLYYIYSHREKYYITTALGLIAGGAIGNIIDRIRFGRVVDFLDFDFFDINLFGYNLERWWTFNIADAVISCSIVYLLIKIFFFTHPQPHPADTPKNHSFPSL
ncbi:MAG: signal peptidase II [Candidatus Zixiibacteriota bacterium]